MKKTILAITLICAAIAMSAVENDKKLHYLVSFSGYYMTQNVLYQSFDINEPLSCAGASLIVLGVGELKEYFDYRDNGKWNNADRAYNYLGVFSGVIISPFLNRIIFPKKYYSFSKTTTKKTGKLSKVTKRRNNEIQK